MVQKLVAVLIISYGWRGAYIALGMMIFTLLFVVLLLLRDDPVKYHLHPDLGLEDIHPNNNNNNNNNDTASSSPPLANINNTDDVVDELTRDGYKMLSYKELLDIAEENMVIDHYDDNPLNNQLSNCVYSTSLKNSDVRKKWRECK